ncbi:hypothetical protein QJS04_geneDACA013807 [Acorus gramineus]|uniref:Uncharacterized protein n=1 Tax=Acorus gramineus TaxID=55184 RepID=A0AAV9AWN4_ACOGR|nr:hypothetical protein QJS04_geneDACA013807 [Acorus gramineus]
MVPPSTIYEAVGHGGGGGSADVLFCVIIVSLSIISWITFAWGGGDHGSRSSRRRNGGGHHAPLFAGGCDVNCDGKCEYCGTYLS